MLTSHQGISCLEVFNWLVFVCGNHQCQVKNVLSGEGGCGQCLALAKFSKYFWRCSLIFDPFMKVFQISVTQYHWRKLFIE